MKEETNFRIGHGIKIAIEIGILIFAIGIAWTTIRGTVKGNKEDIIKHDKRIGKTEEKISQVEKDIGEINIHQQYIRDGIDDIKKKLP